MEVPTCRRAFAGPEPAGLPSRSHSAPWPWPFRRTPGSRCFPPRGTSRSTPLESLSRTGVLFPFFAAWLGMIGVFLTGSDTSSNTLFGPLQATTAKLSGLDPILMGATNSSAGVMGKMISPQNLSVGAAGVGAVGREGEIFSKVIFHSLILTALMGVLAMLQAYVMPWMVPTL